MKRIALALVATLALTTGCSKIREKLAEKAAEKAIETTTGGDVKVSSGGVTVKDDKTGGSVSVGTGAKAPDGWPSSVPIYPGATIQASMSNDNGRSVVLQTKDAPAKVTEFYKGKLGGMKKQAELDLGAAKTIAWKDGKTNISLMVTSSNDGQDSTTIQLSVADK